MTYVTSFWKRRDSDTCGRSVFDSHTATVSSYFRQLSHPAFDSCVSRYTAVAPYHCTHWSVVFHEFHDWAPAIGRFAVISRLIVKSICLIFLKLRESDFLLYATRFSIMRSLVKRLGMGLPNNLLPKFPAITGSLIDRSIDLLLIFLEICLAAHAIAHWIDRSVSQPADLLIFLCLSHQGGC